jgi:hypothetical protein
VISDNESVSLKKHLHFQTAYQCMGVHTSRDVRACQLFTPGYAVSFERASTIFDGTKFDSGGCQTSKNLVTVKTEALTSSETKKQTAQEGVEPQNRTIIEVLYTYLHICGCVCMCGCVYEWVCVCVGFVMCGCVYVWVCV